MASKRMRIADYLPRVFERRPVLDRWAAVDGDRMRMLTVEEYRAAMGFPAGYRLPSDKRTAVHLLGNAVVPPVATWLLGRVLEAA